MKPLKWVSTERCTEGVSSVVDDICVCSADKQTCAGHGNWIKQGRTLNYSQMASEVASDPRRRSFQLVWATVYTQCCWREAKGSFALNIWAASSNVSSGSYWSIFTLTSRVFKDNRKKSRSLVATTETIFLFAEENTVWWNSIFSMWNLNRSSHITWLI